MKAPKSVAFCAHSSIGENSCDNLTKHGFTFVGWCYMCQCSGETVDCLLIYYEVAYTLWSLVFRTFGIPCVLLRRGVDPLFGWRNLLGKHSLEIWNVVPLCEVAVVEGQE